MEEATFGAGCFWGVEAAFRQLDGVLTTSVGYLGGDFENPTYQHVCSGQTGHAEVVRIEYDSDRVSYHDLLDLFWKVHDPTTLNRQGPDIGNQYRSAIFTHDEAQQATAVSLTEELTVQGVFDDPIVTQIVPFERFWPAGDLHRQYFQRNPAQPYCMMVVGPKLSKFRQRFAHRLK